MKEKTLEVVVRLLEQECDSLAARIKMYRHLCGDKLAIKGLERELKDAKAALRDLKKGMEKNGKA